jgi:hypothetical protein
LLLLLMAMTERENFSASGGVMKRALHYWSRYPSIKDALPSIITAITTCN